MFCLSHAGNTAKLFAHSRTSLSPALPRTITWKSHSGTPFRSLNTHQHVANPSVGNGFQANKAMLITGITLVGASVTYAATERGNALTEQEVRLHTQNLAAAEEIGFFTSKEYLSHMDDVHFKKNKTSFLQAFRPENNLPKFRGDDFFLSFLKHCLHIGPQILHRSNLQIACMMAEKIDNSGESPTYLISSCDMDAAMKYIQKLCHANLDSPIKFKFLVTYGNHSSIIDFKIAQGKLSAVIIDSFGTEDVQGKKFSHSHYVAEPLEFIARNAKQLNIPCDIFIASNRIQGNSQLCDVINIDLINRLNNMQHDHDIHDHCRENGTKNAGNQYLLRKENQQYNACVHTFDLPLSLVSSTQSLTRMEEYYKRANTNERSQLAAAGITDVQTFVQTHACVENGKNKKTDRQFEEFHQLWDQNITNFDDLNALYEKAHQFNSLRFKEKMEEYGNVFNDEKSLKISDSFDEKYKGTLRNTREVSDSPCAGGSSLISTPL